MIRDVKIDDAAAVCEIYNYYVEQTVVTFEEEAISQEQMRERIVEKTARYPWIVYEVDGRILGYAYVSNWRGKSAYRFSVENTIYVDKDAAGRGIGKQLMEALLERLKQAGFHAVIAVISLPNEPSIRLHEKFGFEKIGHFKQTGYKFDRWIDVGYFELLLSRGE